MRPRWSGWLYAYATAGAKAGMLKAPLTLASTLVALILLP